MKRTLYLKLLGGYLLFGLLGFLIIATFTYRLTFQHLEKKGSSEFIPGICPDLIQLCAELFQQFHDIR